MSNYIDFNSITPQILGASQKGQDSYIDYILKCIGTTNKYYVEFGAVDGHLYSNTFYLRQNGWTGLLLDSCYNKPEINLHQKFITAENICNIFAEYNVPEIFDFLSVDIDGNDFWVLQAILEKYKPRFIITEANVRFEPNKSLAHKYDPNWRWNGNGWCGSSPLAFNKMVQKFNYHSVGVYLDDMFIVHDSSLHIDNITKKWEEIYPQNNPDLYISHGPSQFIPEDWVEI